MIKSTTFINPVIKVKNIEGLIKKGLSIIICVINVNACINKEFCVHPVKILTEKTIFPIVICMVNIDSGINEEAEYFR
ncbi:hypothetical protein [Klebsiella pneumoniae IS39]|nr:hypothetical protein [Klebsiella pneumoniae IS39]